MILRISVDNLKGAIRRQVIYTDHFHCILIHIKVYQGLHAPVQIFFFVIDGDDDTDLLFHDLSPSLDFPYHFKIRSEEHTSELQSRFELVCRLLLEKKKIFHSTT